MKDYSERAHNKFGVDSDIFADYVLNRHSGISKVNMEICENNINKGNLYQQVFPKEITDIKIRKADDDEYGTWYDISFYH